MNKSEFNGIFVYLFEVYCQTLSHPQIGPKFLKGSPY